MLGLNWQKGKRTETHPSRKQAICCQFVQAHEVWNLIDVRICCQGKRALFKPSKRSLVLVKGLIEARVVDVLAQEEEAQEGSGGDDEGRRKEEERKRERGGDYIAKREGSWRGSDSLYDAPKLKLRMSLGWREEVLRRGGARGEKERSLGCAKRKYINKTPQESGSNYTEKLRAGTATTLADYGSGDALRN